MIAGFATARRAHMADRENDARRVYIQICIECGREYTFDSPPDGEQVCGKCGNTVFRSYFESAVEDEVDRDFREQTERDTATDDPATDIAPGDLTDLESL
jgi:predicted  nucleic acid-binding Zn-ribbon protein